MSVDRDNLYVGKRVVWRHRPRGGYGFVMRLPVTIAALTTSRATVVLEDTGKKAIVSRLSLVEPSTMRGVHAEVEPR